MARVERRHFRPGRRRERDRCAGSAWSFPRPGIWHPALSGANAGQQRTAPDISVRTNQCDGACRRTNSLLDPGPFFAADDFAAATGPRDVSLHDPRLSDGGDDGDAQRARPFFHPGDGRNDAQRGDDRLRLVAGAEIWRGAAEGTKAAGADFRTRLRRAGGGFRRGAMPPCSASSAR